MSLPGVFVIPEPPSKLESHKMSIIARDIDDFSPKNSAFSITIRASKIKGSIRDDAVFYPGSMFAYPN